MTPTRSATVRIPNALGLHARPAAHFVRCSNRYVCDVEVARDGVVVNGKSIMGVMMLAAEKGSTLEIRVTGKDADDAIRDLVELVENGFHEDDEGRPVRNGDG